MGSVRGSVQRTRPNIVEEYAPEKWRTFINDPPMQTCFTLRVHVAVRCYISRFKHTPDTHTRRPATFILTQTQGDASSSQSLKPIFTNPQTSVNDYMCRCAYPHIWSARTYHITRSPIQLCCVACTYRAVARGMSCVEGLVSSVVSSACVRKLSGAGHDAFVACVASAGLSCLRRLTPNVCMCVCLSLNGALRLQVFQIRRSIAGAHVSMHGIVPRRALLEHIGTSRVGAL